MHDNLWFMPSYNIESNWKITQDQYILHKGHKQCPYLDDIFEDSFQCDHFNKLPSFSVSRFGIYRTKRVFLQFDQKVTKYEEIYRPYITPISLKQLLWQRTKWQASTSDSSMSFWTFFLSELHYLIKKRYMTKNSDYVCNFTFYACNISNSKTVPWFSPKPKEGNEQCFI